MSASLLCTGYLGGLCCSPYRGRFVLLQMYAFIRCFGIHWHGKKLLLPAWLFPKTYRRKKFLVESECEFPHTAIKTLTWPIWSSKDFFPCRCNDSMHNSHTKPAFPNSLSNHTKNIVLQTSSFFFSPCKHCRPTRNCNRQVIDQECRVAQRILQRKVL